LRPPILEASGIILPVRWHYRDAPLVWLFPIAFALHILEEWFGGFPEWMALPLGSELPRAAFIAINAVAWIAMVLAARAAIAREENGWMAIAVATIVFVNALLHVVSSLATRSYSPGLFTSVVLYLPLGQLALARAWLQAPDGLFGRGVLVGLALHAIVVAVAYASAV
jgi:hypothetical protein